jgi:hypothetical protein
MQMKDDVSRRAISAIGRALRLLATLACLWPAVAAAQTWNPTGSDANFNTADGGLALPNHASTGPGNYNAASGVAFAKQQQARLEAELAKLRQPLEGRLAALRQ